MFCVSFVVVPGPNVTLYVSRNPKSGSALDPAERSKVPEQPANELKWERGAD